MELGEAISFLSNKSHIEEEVARYKSAIEAVSKDICKAFSEELICQTSEIRPTIMCSILEHCNSISEDIIETILKRYYEKYGRESILILTVVPISSGISSISKYSSVYLGIPFFEEICKANRGLEKNGTGEEGSLEVDWKKMYDDKSKELLAIIANIEDERKYFNQRHDDFRKKEGKYVEMLKVVKDTMKTEGRIGKSFENAFKKRIAQCSDIDAGIMFKEPKEEHKIVLIGPTCAGKTALLKRKEEGVFEEPTPATIGADYKTFRFEECPNVRFQFWDTVGVEKFRNFVPIYLRGSDVVVVCYDMSDDECAMRTEPYFKICVDEGIEPKKIVLTGLKEDKGTTNREFVDAMKRKYGYQFYLEASAKTGKGVDEFFRRIAMHSVEVGET